MSGIVGSRFNTRGSGLVGSLGTDGQVFTSSGAGAGAVFEAASVANDAITLAKMASGTDGNIISYDASGNPVAIATGSDGQVLTSTGAGSPPAFETLPTGGTNTPAFEARNGSNQDIGYTGVYTKITANTEVFDTNSKYDNSTNYRFTPTVAGKYYCYANIQFETTSASNSGDNLITTTAAIYKNGTAAAYSQLNKGAQAAGYKKRSEQVISILDLDADDYIELYAMGDNGIAGSTRVVADATATYFGAFKIIE